MKLGDALRDRPAGGFAHQALAGAMAARGGEQMQVVDQRPPRRSVRAQRTEKTNGLTVAVGAPDLLSVSRRGHAAMPFGLQVGQCRTIKIGIGHDAPVDTLPAARLDLGNDGGIRRIGLAQGERHGQTPGLCDSGGFLAKYARMPRRIASAIWF